MREKVTNPREFDYFSGSPAPFFAPIKPIPMTARLLPSALSSRVCDDKIHAAAQPKPRKYAIERVE